MCKSCKITVKLHTSDTLTGALTEQNHGLP